MAKLKKVKICPICKTTLLYCDKDGTLNEAGGYTICPVAIEENQKDTFLKPFKFRYHKEARIEETEITKKKRLEDAAASKARLQTELEETK